MVRITLAEYNKKSPDSRGIWTSADRPEWIGRRTMLDYDPNAGTVLLIEGESFEIIEEGENVQPE